jgi:tetrahydromethanopterin S-methyltransferase subunit F
LKNENKKQKNIVVVGHSRFMRNHGIGAIGIVGFAVGFVFGAIRIVIEPVF